MTSPSRVSDLQDLGTLLVFLLLDSIFSILTGVGSNRREGG